jgi:hypothetical protein
MSKLENILFNGNDVMSSSDHVFNLLSREHSSLHEFDIATWGATPASCDGAIQILQLYEIMWSVLNISRVLQSAIRH